MADAQIIGAVAVRVEADISEYTETMRAVRVGIQAMERNPIKLKIQVDTTDLDRVQQRLGALRQAAASAGSARFAGFGGGGGSHVASMPPSFTVDGRGFLVNGAGFPVGGGTVAGGPWGNRFASGNAGVLNAEMMAMMSPVSPAAAAASAATASSAGLNATVGNAYAAQAAQGAVMASPRGGGNFMNRRFLRDLFIGGYAANLPLAVGNAYVARSAARSSAMSQEDLIRAEQNFQGTISSSVPVLGPIAKGGAELIGAPFGISTAQTNAVAAAAGQGNEFVNARYASIERVRQERMRQTLAAVSNDRIASESARIDTGRESRIADIRNQYRTEFDKLGVATGDAEHDADRARRMKILNDAKDKEITEAEKTAKLEHKALAVRTSWAKDELGIRENASRAMIAAGASGNNEITRARLGIDQAVQELALSIRQAPVALRGSVAAAGNADIAARRQQYGIMVGNANQDLRVRAGAYMIRNKSSNPNDPIAAMEAEIYTRGWELGKEYREAPAETRNAVYNAGVAEMNFRRRQLNQMIQNGEYDAQTRMGAAAIHTNATALNSDKFINDYTSVYTEGRNLIQQVRNAPDRLRPSILRAAIAEVKGRRADLTRVGSQTFSESYNPQFESVGGMQMGGESVQELRTIKGVLDNQLTELKKIGNNKATISK